MRIVAMNVKILLLLIISVGVLAGQTPVAWSIEFSPEKGNVASVQRVPNWWESSSLVTCTFKNDKKVFKKDGEEIAEENISEKNLFELLKNSNFSEQLIAMGVENASILSSIDTDPNVKKIFDGYKDDGTTNPYYDIKLHFQDGSDFSIFSTKRFLNPEYLRELLAEVGGCIKKKHKFIENALPEVDFNDYTLYLPHSRADIVLKKELRNIQEKHARTIENVVDEKTAPLDSILTYIKLDLALKYINYRWWKEEQNHQKKQKALYTNRSSIPVFVPRPSDCLKIIVSLLSKIKGKLI
jgi:hypothetical protein